MSSSPSPAAEAPSAEEEADGAVDVEAVIEMEIEIDAGGGDDGAEGTSAEADGRYEEGGERKSPNEWGDAEDAAIRAAVAAAAVAAAAAGGSAAAASGGAEDGDDDSSDGGDGSIDEAGVDKSPNEWGAAEDRAIHAAVAAAAASKPAAAADADGDGDEAAGWEASAAESLAEHPAIELLSEDDDEDEEGGDLDESPLEPMPEPRPPPPPRVQYALETPTTEAQREAEEECAPFFVDLRTLPGEQVLHLRAVGLLPPEGVPAGGKAARVLGGENNEEEEEEDDDGGPERADGPSSSSSSEERGDLDAATSIRLLRGRHAAYLTRALTQPLSRGFVALDASRPWIVYWTLHSLDLLDALPYEDVLWNVVRTLDKCWEELEVELDAEEVRTDAILSKYVEDGGVGAGGGGKVKVPAGGFGGGPGQMAHCAPSYAAVLALCIVYGAGRAREETPESARAALDLLRAKRERLYAWYLSLRRPLPSLSAPPPSSSFSSSSEEEAKAPAMVGYRMHHDGEVDVRATYTMLAVTELLHITTPHITHGAAAYVSACQTYEGGFGGEPHSEAHGGYTFCAVAALRLLLGPDARAAMDADALAGWLARRQMAYEGGFQGRSNKLVDGCYSFWQGGGAAVLDVCNDARLSSDPHASGVGLGEDDGEDSDGGGLSFDRLMLQRYVLLCAQDVNGGLRDKPSKPRDFYHSCYNLSGLSVAQHVLAPGGGGGAGGAEGRSGAPAAAVWGDREKNEVGATHPVFNIRVEKVEAALAQFGGSAAAGRPR